MKLLTNLFVLIALSLSLTLAQDRTTIEADTAAIDELSRYLILGEVGIGGGWPGYQLYHVHTAFKSNDFGVVFRASWTGSGPHLMLAGRYYPPIGLPVPAFVSAGVGLAGAGPVFSTTVGTNVPLGLGNPFRITLEAGGAYTTASGQGQFLPTIAVGVGYSFFIDQAPISDEERALRRAEEEARRAGCFDPAEPDPSKLGNVISRAIERELAEARVSFPGYSLRNLSYSYDTDIDGNIARISGRWDATVVEPGGRESSGSGSILATLSWNGCEWTLISYSFN